MQDWLRRANTDELSTIEQQMRGVGIQRHEIPWRKTALTAFQCGPMTGPQVLLLHGVTYSSASVFHLTIPGHSANEYSLILQLSESLGCWCLDFSGYGFSPSPSYSAAETIDDYVEQVGEAVRYLHQTTGHKPVLVGWSWGGQVASRYAGRHGDSLAGFVYWGAIWGGTGQAEFVKSTPKPTAPRRVNTRQHAGADFKTPNTFDPEVRTQFIDCALRLDPTSPTTGLTESLYNLPLHEPRDIKVPTLVIHGEHDFVAQFDDVRDYFDALASPIKQHRIIAQADHNVQYSKKRHTLVRELRDFSHQCDPLSLNA
ncbi:alpha/beta hydrolase [Vibrio sp. Isolate22]|uniref:alpha/beta hydrolase n=1 Tax=Vibrio sp. Isolate22 TaxID=2908532 RepID=UPI001EFD2ADE|nr:alpha/beta hydrolase [Vibrio sp. Isolate22]MCG9692032.1 alpha/beta hydrolase [Vibrio sp. Isolate22]